MASAAPTKFRKNVLPPSNVGNAGAVALGQSALPRRPFTDVEIKSAFEAFDLDGNRFVGAAELRHLLNLIGEAATDEEIDAMITMCDPDGDGQVGFDDFLRVMSAPYKLPEERDGELRERRQSTKVRGRPTAALMKDVGDMPEPSGGAVAPSELPALRKHAEFQAAQAERSGVPASSQAGAASLSGAHSLDELMNEFGGGQKMKPAIIKKVYKKFQAVDENGTGKIEYPEFLTVMGQKDSDLMRRMFQSFDMDKSGSIELREFVVVLSKYTTATREQKLKFAFYIYDADGSGEIERPELERVVQANFVSENLSQAALKRKVDMILQASGSKNDRLTYEQFMSLSVQQNGLLYPVNQTQAHLRTV